MKKAETSSDMKGNSESSTMPDWTDRAARAFARHALEIARGFEKEDGNVPYNING